MEKTGTVYFFTGLSGAGKSTIGGLFFQRLRAQKPNVFLLDGDRYRREVCEDLGYTEEDRLKAARRGFRLSRWLADQGIDVVNCGIAMYEEIRKWNRENIDSYREIYIKVSRETLLRRNQHGLYRGGKNVVGVDLPFEEPQRSDVVVENNGMETPDAIVDRLVELFELSRKGYI